jgi:hypothetical protein
MTNFAKGLRFGSFVGVPPFAEELPDELLELKGEL